MTSSSEVVARSDSATEYATETIAGLEQSALEEIDDLMTSLRARDVELWQHLNVSPETAIDDYDEVEPKERDLTWVLGLAGMSSAALYQFFLHHREETLIKPLAYRMQILDGVNLTPAAAIVAGTRAFSEKTAIERAVVSSTYAGRLAKLRNVSNAQLYDLLLQRAAIQPIDAAIANAAGYVGRMTPYPSGSPQFQGAVADLVASNSKRGLMSMDRRAIEVIYTEREAGGDMSQRMVWIIEDDPNTCDYCSVRAGEIRTYEEWIEDGLPGASVCAGGDLCRCHLIAV